GLTGLTLLAAELSEAASHAYADYVSRVRQSFLDRATHASSISDADRSALRQGETVVRPGGSDGIIDAPSSLIHHWFASAMIPGVTLDQTVTVSRAYRDYPKIFHPVMAVNVLSDDGDSMRIEFRMKESAAGMSATIDMTSHIQYSRVDAKHAYVI